MKGRKLKILKINPRSVDIEKIKEASNLIKEGKIVAFPTETVYGLGADALNAKAVARIYEIKNRPSFDPLIVHIANKKDIFRLTYPIEEVENLIDDFWPGPLTLVLKKRSIIPDIVSAGLDTVAVRMPANNIALELIKYASVPIAAPSANLFGRPSPTCAKHVIEDFGDKLDLIIDGGKTKIGLESTVLDLTSKPFRILRPGGISLEQLQPYNVVCLEEEKTACKNSDKLLKQRQTLKEEQVQKMFSTSLSPGMLPTHYSPNVPLILIEKSNVQMKKMREEIEKFIKRNKKVGLIITQNNKNNLNRGKVLEKVHKFYVVDSTDSFKYYAVNLFSFLREFERRGIEIILVEGIGEEGLGYAIMNRLRKAASKIII